jgi:predicted nucleic acid-binding protein
MSPAAARTSIDYAVGLDQEIVPITRGHLRRALDLQAGVRVVDGLYVALAEERGAPLLTTDRRLARAVTTCEVLVPPD